MYSSEDLERFYFQYQTEACLLYTSIKDVARVQKLPLSESDRLCKLVPDKIPDKKMNLPNAIAYVPELQACLLYTSRCV